MSPALPAAETYLAPMLCRATVVVETAERARARSTHREDQFYARLRERIGAGTTDVADL